MKNKKRNTVPNLSLVNNRIKSPTSVIIVLCPKKGALKRCPITYCNTIIKLPKSILQLKYKMAMIADLGDLDEYQEFVKTAGSDKKLQFLTPSMLAMDVGEETFLSPTSSIF